MIIINLEKAKNIWRDKIRSDRVPVFEKLDVAYIRAIETNNISEQNNIIAKKEILRNAPNDPRIANATSTDELLTIDPIKEIGF